MVGLSVVLEAQKGGNGINKKTPQVINKTTMILSTGTINKPSHSPPLPPPPAPAVSSQLHHSLFQAPTFLDQCFLCRKRLLLGQDIYMYKGDRAFCSVDCRCKQIFRDEEEAAIQNQKGNCSLAAITMRPTSSASSSSSSSSSARHHRKGPRNRAATGAFAY